MVSHHTAEFHLHRTSVPVAICAVRDAVLVVFNAGGMTGSHGSRRPPEFRYVPASVRADVEDRWVEADVVPGVAIDEAGLLDAVYCHVVGETVRRAIFASPEFCPPRARVILRLTP